MPRATIDFHPLTADRWQDLEALFGQRGACGGCWCMTWRLPRAQFERQKGDANRDALRAIVEDGPPPGILAYAAARPVGWCAVAPREAYPALGRSRVLKPVDQAPVWSVSCLFVARDFRRQGLSAKLLRAAVEFVGRQGGRVVEGYPVEPKAELPAPFVWTGLPSAFLKAGFVECARHSPSRPIMRCEIKPRRAAGRRARG